MEIRKTRVEKFENIKNIYKHARDFVVESGNLTQWQILNIC